MSESELDSLAADIKANGQRYPILTLDEKILDGRNRWLACAKAGVAPRFEAFTGDADALVKSLNIERRHSNESQRAMIAAKLANMPRGNSTGNNQHKRKCKNSDISTSQGEAAELLKVSRQSVNEAKRILETAPEEVAAIERGEKSINQVKTALQDHYEPGHHKIKAASEEADALFQLKRWWKKAGQKDRKQFLSWVKAKSGGKQNK